MQFARLGPVGAEIPVVIHDDRAWDLRSLTADIEGAFLATGTGAVTEALSAGSLPEVPRDGIRIGAPVARPGAVICVGMNYVAHAAESGSAPPDQPVLFFKHPNTVVGPNDPLVLPSNATKLDWEVELVIVIGQPAYQLATREDALAAVAGYTVADDVSERSWQIDVSGGQWSKGKCGPGFSPLGPVVVTPDEFDPSAVRIRSWVNGGPRQDSNTRDMIFDIPTILLDITRYMRLDPGDIVLTGTPQGVALSGRFPYLQAGDVVEVGIEGIGTQRHEVVAQTPALIAGGTA